VGLPNKTKKPSPIPQGFGFLKYLELSN